MIGSALVLNTVWQIAGVVLWLLLGIVFAGIVIGVPSYLGYLAYQTASQKDLFNPAALGFAAGFFSLLVIVVIAGLIIVFGL